MDEFLTDLIKLLAKLPGVGDKTAARLALHVLDQPDSYAAKLGSMLTALHSEIQRCHECGNYTANSLCKICQDPKRDETTICVVAHVQDLWAVERLSAFRGRYFVLHGLMAPLEGVGPGDINLVPLVQRVENGTLSEVIIATPLSVDGEATALLISHTLKNTGVKISRLASGLPHGAELEYSDRVTLEKSFEGRHTL